MKLWEYLGVSQEATKEEVDLAFRELSKGNPTKEQITAWKVLRDRYYSKVYKKYENMELLEKAGFFEDTLGINEVDQYYLEVISAELNKVYENYKKRDKNKTPVVLVSTGGFYPIHVGHIRMMEIAAETLNKQYDVIGGYMSLCHDDYVSHKPYFNNCAEERIHNAQQVLLDNDWLSTETWECSYCKTTVNFSTVLDRLEKYIHRYIGDDILIAYVFGSDNAEFAYCFEDSKNLCVCINRAGYNDRFKQTKDKLWDNTNIYFKYNNEDSQFLQSREIRSRIQAEKGDAKGVYIVRNEGTRPLNYLNSLCNESKISLEQHYFLNRFKDVLAEFNKSLQVKVVDVDEQLKYANNKLLNKPTISMDIYFEGTNQLGVSRVFRIGDGQFKCQKLIGRNRHESLEDVVRTIKPGEYTLVDDDSVSGTTIKFVKDRLPSDVKVTDTFLLSSILPSNVYDVVDLRDFIFGSQHGGLLVNIGTEYIRVPYMMPYVDLQTRASIPMAKAREFSVNLWKLNKQLYHNLGNNIKIRDTYAKYLAKYIGLDLEMTMEEACSWHLKILGA